jgi:hypothetical protein
MATSITKRPDYLGCYWLATESPNIFEFTTDEHIANPGFYIESRLTVNGITLPDYLNIIASPNPGGLAQLDVSGVLRIVTSLGKTGDYSTLLMAEPTKSGYFTLAWRTRWFGKSDDEAVNPYTSDGGSPGTIWWYAECVRSEEQGSNLYDYVSTGTNDAPFLNSFAEPVFFLGLPFDLSFIMPDIASAPVTVTIRRYNSANTLLGTTTTVVASAALEGFVNSLNIDPASIELQCAYLTCEIAA